MGFIGASAFVVIKRVKSHRRQILKTQPRTGDDVEEPIPTESLSPSTFLTPSAPPASNFLYPGDLNATTNHDNFAAPPVYEDIGNPVHGSYEYPHDVKHVVLSQNAYYGTTSENDQHTHSIADVIYNLPVAVPSTFEHQTSPVPQIEGRK